MAVEKWTQRPDLLIQVGRLAAIQADLETLAEELWKQGEKDQVSNAGGMERAISQLRAIGGDMMTPLVNGPRQAAQRRYDALSEGQ